MSVKIIDTLKPKNNGSFPIVEAVDVAVSSDLRLPEALEAKADVTALAEVIGEIADKAGIEDLEALAEQITTPFNFKGTVETEAELPSTAELNDTYFVTELNYRVTWNGTEFTQNSLDEGEYEDELSKVSDNVDAVKADLTELPKRAYNKNNNTSGYYLSSSGEMIASATWNVTEKFDVTQGSVTYSGITTVTSSAKACFFDADDDFVSYFVISTSETTIIDIPSEAKYVRFSVHNSDVDSFKCEYQFLSTYADSKNAVDSAKAYVESRVIDVENDMRNLPNIQYDDVQVTSGYYLDSTGTPTHESNWGYTEKLRIDGKSFKYGGVSVISQNAYSFFYDANGELIEGSGFHTVKDSEATVQEVPTSAVYVSFSIRNSDFDSFYVKYKLFDTDASVDMSFLFDLPYVKPQIKQDEITKGYYLDVNGEEVYQANWGYTAKIQIDHSKPFEYSGISTASSSGYCHFYDADGDLIANSGFRAVANVPTTVSTIPSNAKYVVFTLFKDDYSTFSLRYKLFDTASSIQSIWKGKNYISHGDSITYYDGHEYPGGGICKGYQSVMNDSIGFDTITNQGRSGYSMADRTGHNGIVSTILATNHVSQDLCSIFAGTNDFKLDVPIGTIGVIGDTELDRTTFYGAYRTAIEHILTQKPSIRLVLFTPLQRNNDGYDVNTTNTAGHKLIDYVDAVKAVGKLYGLPVCDLYANSGFTQLTLSAYTIDGLHPNDAGHKRIGDYLVSFVNSVGN